MHPLQVTTCNMLFFTDEKNAERDMLTQLCNNLSWTSCSVKTKLYINLFKRVSFIRTKKIMLRKNSEEYKLHKKQNSQEKITGFRSALHHVAVKSTTATICYSCCLPLL